MILKLQLGTEIRRVTLAGESLTFDQLRQTAFATFGVEPSSLTFSYLDWENDHITITNDDDMREMFRTEGGRRDEKTLTVFARKTQDIDASRRNSELMSNLMVLKSVGYKDEKLNLRLLLMHENNLEKVTTHLQNQ